MGDQVRTWAADVVRQSAAVALVADLERRGLAAEVIDHGAVRACNPAGEPGAGDPRARALSPGLRQEVVCRTHRGALWWWWVWSGPDRRALSELEPLCPAANTAFAGERIARVLAVPFASSPDGASGGCE
ncbi:hypothetical protein ACFFWA_16945 [Actinomadura verrucosospora]|uniref:hypothetical protein n=1 Tax=Actinomadura verrucosospora TaxID=46165 RepID=UPI0031EC1F25